MKVSEFKAAVIYPSIEEDLARYRILVSDHKTAGVYGAAVVWVYDDLYKLMDMHLRTVRSQFAATAATEVEQFFYFKLWDVTGRLRPACMYICHIRKIISLPWLSTRRKLKPGITVCMAKLENLI